MTKVFAYVIASAILAGVFYALVVSPYVLDVDVKLWLTGLAGAASTFVFGDQVASRTARQAESASATGAAQALSTPTITTSSGPPATVTVSSPDPVAAPLEEAPHDAQG